MAIVFDFIENGVENVINALDGVNQKMGASHKTNLDAAGALNTFGVNLSALNSPLTAVAGAIKDSIDTTVAWGQTIDKLSRASGENATETSKMAVVLGDYGINVDSLDKVVKTFTKNGLQFNLETVKKLAVEYQAIQDPVKRDEFAFKNFGRSAMDMTEILSKTPAELEAVGNAAMTSGKIMNEQGVEAVQQFGVKTAQLTDKLDGLKIAIGGPLVSTLSNAVDGFNGVVATINALDIAVEAHTGMITWDQAAARADAAAHGDLTAAFHDAKIGAQTAGEQTSVYTRSLLDLAAAQKTTTRTYSDAASIIAGYTNNVNLQATSQYNAKTATDAANASAKTQSDQLLLSAATSGAITSAEQTYAGVIDGNADKIGKLRDEIAKMTAANGEAFTIVTKGTHTQEDYNLAVDRAALALAKYTNHGKVSAQGLEGLRIAAESAQNAVDKMGQSMGSTTSGTADYTTKIGADQTALDALTKANDDAAAAMAKSTGAFILQQVAAAAGPEVQLQLAHALGLVDDKSYNLALNVQSLTKAWDLNHNGMIDVGAEADGLSKALHGSQTAVEQAAGVIPKLVTHTDELAGSTATAAGNVGLLRDGINDLHDKNITITTNMNTVWHDSHPGGVGGVAGGAAGGADYIVPPGYPNDSYLQPVQSGEHVQVTPAGQKPKGSGVTIHVDARGSLDPSAVEAAGYRGALRAMQAAGYRADQISRMGVS